MEAKPQQTGNRLLIGLFVRLQLPPLPPLYGRGISIQQGLISPVTREGSTLLYYHFAHQVLKAEHDIGNVEVAGSFPALGSILRIW